MWFRGEVGWKESPWVWVWRLRPISYVDFLALFWLTHLSTSPWHRPPSTRRDGGCAPDLPVLIDFLPRYSAWTVLYWTTSVILHQAEGIRAGNDGDTAPSLKSCSVCSFVGHVVILDCLKWARSEVFFLNYSFVICLFNRLPFPYHPPWDYLPFHHSCLRRTRRLCCCENGY